MFSARSFMISMTFSSDHALHRLLARGGICSLTSWLLAQAKNAKGDKGAAIKDLETAVQLDPQNTQAKNQLQQLKGQ